AQLVERSEPRCSPWLPHVDARRAYCFPLPDIPVCAAARPHRPGSFQRIVEAMALRSYSSDQLRRICGSCALAFLLCIIVLALLDARGFGGKLAAIIIALVPLALFCAAGLATSTADPLEFQIAGRRLSAPFAGMTAAAQWSAPALLLA